MSEKRFKVVQDPRVQTEYFIYDNENKISGNITDYPFSNQDVCSRIVRLLNEQQSIIEAKDKEIEESKITIQLYETDVSMRDNFLKSKGLYDEFLQCIMDGE